LALRCEAPSQQPFAGTRSDGLTDFDSRCGRRTWSYPVAQVKVGSTAIEKGDLLFLDSVDGLRDKGVSTASWCGFPFAKLSRTTRSLSSNMELASTYFLGVAAWHSDLDDNGSGVTREIGVWVEGLFQYPLKRSRTIKPLYRVLPCGSGVTLYNQRIQADSSGSTKYIGICAEHGKWKSSARAILRSRTLIGWSLD
jgi:hypothetical protein